MSARTLTYTKSGCTVTLPKQQHYCASSASGCPSYANAAIYSISMNRRERNCKALSHTVITGTLSQATIRATGTGCNSYDGSLKYMFANSTSCLCE